MVTFEEILTQAIAMLQRLGRVSYRTLKVQFQLDDDLLELLDGIMALFEAPLAHEDHAVRVCYAALAMQAAVKLS